MHREAKSLRRGFESTCNATNSVHHRFIKALRQRSPQGITGYQISLLFCRSAATLFLYIHPSTPRCTSLIVMWHRIRIVKRPFNRAKQQKKRREKNISNKGENQISPIAPLFDRYKIKKIFGGEKSTKHGGKKLYMAVRKRIEEELIKRYRMERVSPYLG